MSRIRVGTSSWTDKTLLESGWYPPEAKTAEARLAHYASTFPLVEVDSTYYAPPSERNAILWARRTPADFVFNVKAFSLMTGHPTRADSLPKDLRAAAKGRSRVYAKDLPSGAVSEVWEMFRSALMPLHSAGKLGCVLMQYPEWFVPSSAAREEILAAAARLPDYQVAVEFRRASWMDTPERAERTLEFLRRNGLSYVCVDMPQGFDSSVPPVAAATAGGLAVVRFHGRNTHTWKQPGLSAAERFNYRYRDDELAEWLPRVEGLAKDAREVHVLFNNCYRDAGVKDAARMAALVAGL